MLVTLHRPALVDGPLLTEAMQALTELSGSLDVAFPVHPRTRAQLETLGLTATSPTLRLLEPLGYLDFLSLTSSAAAVLTDSGGVQEETTFLCIPCFTLRDNTERPVTVQLGSNTLLGLDPARIAEIPQLLEAQRGRTNGIPQGWDGRAADRIVQVLEAALVPG